MPKCQFRSYINSIETLVERGLGIITKQRRSYTTPGFQLDF